MCNDQIYQNVQDTIIIKEVVIVVITVRLWLYFLLEVVKETGAIGFQL